MKVDLHIHTNFSPDGASSPEEVVQAALEKNLDCICITDHNQIKGAILAMKYAFDKNILVIPGIEIFSQAGDILGINVKKVIPNNLSAEKTINEIRRQGGFAVFPHPFWPPGGLKFKRKVFSLADGIEIFNADLFRFYNKKALLLSRRIKLPFTAGSDAHYAKFVGRGYLEIPTNICSEEELLAEIKNKNGKVRGRSLRFWEKLQNCSQMDVNGLFDYLKFRMRRKKCEKIAGKI